MIVIAEFYARYTSTLTEAGLSLGGENLLGFAETTAQTYYAERYKQFGIRIDVRLEVGSTRSWISIGAIVTVLTQYANIRQSVDYLIKDSHALARLIVPSISRSLGLPIQAPEYHERRLGLPGQLHRLFVQVERREISANEATNRAVSLLESQGGTDVLPEIPRLKEQLSSEFHESQHSLSGNLYIQRSQELHQAGDPRQTPKRLPKLPDRPQPVIPSSPPTVIRRRRRTGIIATRDRQTGHVRITRY